MFFLATANPIFNQESAFWKKKELNNLPTYFGETLVLY